MSRMWHDNTPISEKKNKDPFGINAYARELAIFRRKEKWIIKSIVIWTAY